VKNEFPIIFFIILDTLQYLHFLFKTSNIIYNICIIYLLYLNLVFFLYVGLKTIGPAGIDGPLGVAKEGVDGAKVGKSFAFKVGACDVSYATKWLLQRHLDGTHHLVMEQGKLGHPFTQHEGPRCQDHASMNTKVLVDPLVSLRLNDQKANARTKRKVIEKWTQLQANAERTPPVPRSMLVKLASSHLTNILGIPRWGVGSIPPHVLAKVKKDELASLIHGTKLTYAKAFKASWDSQNLNKGSNKIALHFKIKLLITYHESKSIHGQ
jgi:hypothetical protein